jgi:rhamnosyltransferase
MEAWSSEMRVLAVAVTYNPDVSLLAHVLQSVAPQVDGIVVVDNGSENAGQIVDLASAVDARIFANDQNQGIAAAQNQGVEWARRNGFSHVLLLDQDTVLAPGTVEDLSKHLTTLELEQGQVAAIGPAYVELHSNRRTRAYRANGLRLSRISLEAKTQPVATDFIIASGSLIPLSVLEKVGNFKESLFIDLVDTEWCFRARAAGYRTFISPSASVEHRLGSGTITLGLRQIAVHVPVRNYYWVRNALWLARRNYTPPAWRLYFITRSLAFLVAYTTVVDRRALRLRLISRGIWDSLGAHLGRLKQE